MADTAVAITAGTGTNIDTRTEATNGNHRQVIVIGDPATNAGVAPVDATLGLAVNNTAGSAIIGKVGIDQTTDGTTNKVAADLRLAGSAAATGAGASGATVLRTTLASDSPGIVAVGTAGTPSAAVLSVQGAASMTPILATTTNTALTDFGAGEYEYVAASATDQILGATGGVGDYLSHLLIVPETSTPGSVSLTDGNGTARVIFVGGASSVSNLVPFTVAIGGKCVNATTPGWKITTTTNVHVLGFGNFT